MSFPVFVDIEQIFSKPFLLVDSKGEKALEKTFIKTREQLFMIDHLSLRSSGQFQWKTNIFFEVNIKTNFFPRNELFFCCHSNIIGSQIVIFVQFRCNSFAFLCRTTVCSANNFMIIWKRWILQKQKQNQTHSSFRSFFIGRVSS